MMTRFPAFWALLMFSSGASAEPSPLPPTASWVVDFADSQCIASRNYGTADDPLFLFIKAPPIGDVLQIGIVRKGGDVSAAQMDGQIIFDALPPIATTLLEFGAKQEKHTILLANVSRAQLTPMFGASSITVHARDALQPEIARGSRILQIPVQDIRYTLKLTQVRALVDMLDKCAANLRKAWNVEDGAATLVSQEPSGDLRKLFNSDDYPFVAILKEEGGSIRIAMLVDEKGKVADCTVIKTSGIASLDAMSCGIIKERAQMKPAVGLDGKPAKGGLTQKIVWEIQP
jgi:hypothetical protein